MSASTVNKNTVGQQFAELLGNAKFYDRFYKHVGDITEFVEQKFYINLLASELFFFNFSTPVYKMWKIQEQNKLELWNKLHFEEEKNGDYISCLKYSVPIFVE